jgi:cytoskeleton protein RodZ
MADWPRGDFGSTLRAARERRGLSLRQLSDATKISPRALESLERNEFSRLPGGIFSRAFVRTYAIEVGLNPDNTVRQFVDECPPDATRAGEPAGVQTEDPVAVESDRVAATTVVRLVALSVPLAAVLLYFGAEGRPASRREPAPSASTTAGAAVGAPAGAAAAYSEPALAPASPRDRSSASPDEAVPVGTAARTVPGVAAAAADIGPTSARRSAAVVPLTVSLLATRECWVRMMVDGERTAGRLMRAGEQQTIDVRGEFVLTAGDASALAMRLNGVAAKTLGKAGQVVTVRLNTSNFTRYLSGR